MIDCTTLARQRLAWIAVEDAIREARQEAEDRDLAEERSTPPLCSVCGGEVLKDPKNGQWHRLCAHCRAEGYRATPCKGCGGPTKRTDQKGPHQKDQKGYCRRCREDRAEFSTELMQEFGRLGGRRGGGRNLMRGRRA